MLALAACATTRPESPRPRPAQIETCSQLTDRIRLRDRSLSALRGAARVTLAGRSGEADLELLLVTPDKARIEVLGPLGVRVGLLVLNADSFRFFAIRDRTVYRLPTAELHQDTLRRQRFLSLLPVPVKPELLLQGLTTRVSLPEGEVPSCDYDKDANMYRLRLPNGPGGRVVWVDPVSTAPLRVRVFDRRLPKLAEAATARATDEYAYSHLVGEGLATLPRRIDFSGGEGPAWSFEWKSAEAVPNWEAKAFDWEAPASAKIQDY